MDLPMTLGATHGHDALPRASSRGGLHFLRRIDHRSQLSIIDGTLCTSKTRTSVELSKNGRVLVDDELIRFEELWRRLASLGFRTGGGDPEEWQEIPWAIRVHQEGHACGLCQPKMTCSVTALTELVARSLEGWFDSV